MNHKPKIYFITGVCGVGKSAVIPDLKLSFDKKDFDIHDFDERGVPSGVNREWRKKETEFWLNLGRLNLKNNISTIICGFSNPKEVIYNNIDNTRFILLDAEKETIKNRIAKRYKTKKSEQELKRVSACSVESFIEDNADFSEILRIICQNDKRCDIIDTTDKSPKEVAKQITEIIK